MRGSKTSKSCSQESFYQMERLCHCRNRTSILPLGGEQRLTEKPPGRVTSNPLFPSFFFCFCYLRGLTNELLTATFRALDYHWNHDSTFPSLVCSSVPSCCQNWS